LASRAKWSCFRRQPSLLAAIRRAGTQPIAARSENDPVLPTVFSPIYVRHRQVPAHAPALLVGGSKM